MARQPALEHSECPVARTLEAIGERWTLLIIRDAFDGLRRFSEFQKSLGLAKNILAARLKVLTELRLLALQPAADGSAYKEYVLTARGRSVFPLIVCMRQWGEQHLFEAGEAHSVLLDDAGGQPVAAMEVRSVDGRVLGPESCHRTRVIRPSRQAS